MRILDMDNNVINEEDYDYEMGTLVEEELFIAHHPYQEGITEEGHYEVIREYPNGGKDVKWVIDIPGQEEREAWDEYETILRLTPHTEKEKALIEIDKLKNKLYETDYNILKIVEGAATFEEKAEIIASRAAWRKRINELEELFNL